MSVTDWQLVIGIETHIQLNTKSKLFSASPASYCVEPNANANEIDFGLPGTLPVANKEAVAKAIRFGLAVGARVARESEFARKHYFYPDLPKGYQISQFEHPVVVGGAVRVNTVSDSFKVPLVRAHLEEDAGRLLHDNLPGSSVVDLNRAGVPLLEIVSEPALRTAADAREYGRALRELVCWLDICDGNMQEGSIRFDVNISLRKGADDPLGTRSETKNLNSFRFMEQAIEFEAARQAALLEDGGTVVQETRLFDSSTGETRSMRSKEEAEDYRYVPDPDLLPLRISDEWVRECEEAMPELPVECRIRFVKDLGMTEYDANVLTADRRTAAYFDEVAKLCGDPKAAANWVAGELTAMCKEREVEIADCPLGPSRLAGLIGRVLDGTVSGKMGKELMERMWESDEEADAIIDSEGMRQISDVAELEGILSGIISANPKQAEQFRAGKSKLLGFFVGQAMKATKGKGDPRMLDSMARKMLGGERNASDDDA